MDIFRPNYLYLLIIFLALLRVPGFAAPTPTRENPANHPLLIPGVSMRDLAYLQDSYIAAARFDSEKSKKITKTIKVSSNDKLVLDNKYGKVHINTWDKNEVSVTIDIIARASTDERATQMLNTIDIDIDEDRSDHQISFITKINKASNIKSWGNNSGYEINYTVSMPKQNPLQAKNMYGDLYLADYNGNGDISLSYGNLKIGRLGGDNTIKLAYGTGSNSISGLKQGTLNLSYSKLTLDEAGVLELRNNYSDINIGKVGTVNISSRYGSVDIKSVNSLEGSSGYSGFSIGSLTDKIDLKLQYCSGFRIEEISPKFNSINLEGSYSSFNLHFKDNTAFKFDVALQYGDLRVDKEIVQFNVVEKRNTSNMYQGKFGNSSSDSKVTINSRYGDVKFMYQD